MKKLILLLVVLGISFAWTNAALPAVLNSEYRYTECNVKFAQDIVDIRGHCAEENGDDFPDLGANLERIQEAMDDAKGAADSGNGVLFGASMLSARAEMVGLGLKVVEDAAKNKSTGFRSCANKDNDKKKDDLKQCQKGAFADGKVAANDYVEKEIEYGNEQIDDLDGMDADTEGMKKRVQEGEELKGDIPSAYDSEDTGEVMNVYARHSRIVLLFRLEKMVSVIDYAKPIIQAGNNTNKEELVDEMDSIKADTGELIGDCEYSKTVDSEYFAKNTQCWTEGLALIDRFNGLYTLYWEGV